MAASTRFQERNLKHGKKSKTIGSLKKVAEGWRLSGGEKTEGLDEGGKGGVGEKV